MTPTPPARRWLARAGGGLRMSNTRKSTKPAASVGSVSGNGSAASVIPATSSTTIAPGSLTPRTRAARWGAHVPTSVTATREAATVATSSATRSTGVGRLRALADELVPLDLGDADAREPPRREVAPAQVDDAVDLGGLAGRASLPRERGVLARPVHEHVLHRADELRLAVPGEAVLQVLDELRALGRDLGGHRVGEAGRP